MQQDNPSQKTMMTVEADIPESGYIPSITTFNLPFENVVHANLDTLIRRYPTDSKLNRYLESVPNILILKDNKPVVAFIDLKDYHDILEARLVLNFVNNTQLIFDAMGQDHTDLMEQFGIIQHKKGQPNEETK